MQKQLSKFAFGKKISEMHILPVDSTFYSKNTATFYTLWYSSHSLEKPKAIKHVVNCYKIAWKENGTMGPTQVNM